MWQEIKSQFQRFKDDQPGRRFANLYERRQKEWPVWACCLAPALGVLIIAGGLFLIPAPGPGSMVTLLGVGLVGTAVKPVAYWCDVLEVTARSALREVRGWWAQRGQPLRQ